MIKLLIVALLLTFASTQCPKYVIPNNEDHDRKSPPQYLLQVTGTASKEISHDEVTITLKSKAIGPDSKKALEYLNQQIEKVIEAVINLGVPKEELSTETFQISKITHHKPYPHNTQQNNAYFSKPPEGPPAFTGFQVDNNIKVKTKRLNLTERIISAASEAGIKEFSSVAFRVSKEKELEERKNLVGLASQNARLKADTSLQNLGGKVESVKQVCIEKVNFNHQSVTSSARNWNNQAELDQAILETPLNPGIEKMSVEVYVDFNIETI